MVRISAFGRCSRSASPSVFTGPSTFADELGLSGSVGASDHVRGRILQDRRGRFRHRIERVVREHSRLARRQAGEERGVPGSGGGGRVLVTEPRT